MFSLPSPTCSGKAQQPAAPVAQGLSSELQAGGGRTDLHTRRLTKPGALRAAPQLLGRQTMAGKGP